MLRRDRKGSPPKETWLQCAARPSCAGDGAASASAIDALDGALGIAGCSALVERVECCLPLDRIGLERTRRRSCAGAS
jgi:hypothetical protein